MKHEGIPVMSFKDQATLELWLSQHHTDTSGIWVRIYRKHCDEQSVSFEDVLTAGLIWGWSESLRHSFDDISYLQRFAPRKKIGTLSPRNLKIVKQLLAQNRMQPAGLAALGMDAKI